jgi:hypothetical protein
LALVLDAIKDYSISLQMLFIVQGPVRLWITHLNIEPRPELQGYLEGEKSLKEITDDATCAIKT